jgi:enterobactin synthetase component D
MLPVVFDLQLAHCRCVGLALPVEGDPDSPHLTADDLAAAEGFGPARRRTYLGGRAALREALYREGAPWQAPLPSTPRGAPVPPEGWVASISHKEGLAVALVAPDEGWAVGVDLEALGPPRLHLAPRLLTSSEQAQLAAMPPQAQWPELLLRFSAKEALYKAIDPYLQRYVGFAEVAIVPREGRLLGIGELTAPDLLGLEAEGAWAPVDGHLVTAFRARRAAV